MDRGQASLVASNSLGASLPRRSTHVAQAFVVHHVCFIRVFISYHKRFISVSYVFRKYFVSVPYVRGVFRKCFIRVS